MYPFATPASIPSDPEALADEIARTAARLDAATHRLLTCIRSFDNSGEWSRQGALSCAHWLTWRIHLDPGTAREKVRVARALGSLPRTDAALRQGQLSYAKVRALTRVATPENEERLLELAHASTGAQLERLCRKVRRVLTTTEDGDRLDQQRYFKEETLENGMVRLTAVLHPDEAALVAKAIEQARRASQPPANQSTGPGTPVGSVSAESTRRRLISPVDALVQVAESYLAHGDAARSAAESTQIVVHLEQDTLAPDGTLCASLDDGRRVAAETFRRLACDSSLVPILHAATGQILDLGRRTRTVSAALLRALKNRDTGCRFPGCSHRLYVQAHHLEHWAHGGKTTLQNLALLCFTHHRLVHEGGFGITRSPQGDLTFTDARGRVIPSIPPPEPVDTDPFLQLSTWNDQAGATLDDEIPYPAWDGTPMDYDEAVLAVVRA